MKLKTVTIEGKTYAEVQDGKPIFTDDTGKDIAFDAPATVATITRLNGEAKGHREAKEAAEGALKKFEGITDPAKAIEALQTVANLDAGQLVTAGKVQEIKDAAKKAAEEQVTAANRASTEKIQGLEKERDTLTGQLHGEKIGNAFSRSKFIGDKVVIPSDLVQSMFGPQFKVEEGKIVAYDKTGNKLYSPSKPGELADFEEALELVVSQYPYRDKILKGTGNSGGGGQAPNGGGNGKTITRTEFQRLPPADQAAKVTKEGFTVIDG